jgi:hypothetical protein
VEPLRSRVRGAWFWTVQAKRRLAFCSGRLPPPRICRIHKTSYRSIRQIYSALEEIQTFTAGRLAGLTAKLVVRPEETTYFDLKDKQKKSTTIWALSLEVEGEDMRKLVSNLTENAHVFAESRKLLGDGQVLKVIEEEKEQAQEFATEFNSNEAPPVDEGGCFSLLSERCEGFYFYFHQEPIWLEKQTNPVYPLRCASYR